MFWNLTLPELYALHKSNRDKRRDTWLPSCQIISAMAAIWGDGKSSPPNASIYLPEDLKHG